jgi:hypothetical protein
MHDQRLFYASDILPNGDVFVAGGEYSNGLHDRTNTGEIYNPITNTWTSIANFPLSEIGDAPSEVLANGQVLVGSIQGPATYTYNAATNEWSPAANKLNDDSSSEETWVKLPGGSILSYQYHRKHRFEHKPGPTVLTHGEQVGLRRYGPRST